MPSVKATLSLTLTLALTLTLTLTLTSGGTGSDGKRKQDFWVLDLLAMSWSQIPHEAFQG